MGKKYGLASCRSLWPYSRHRSRLGHFVGRLKVVQSAPENLWTVSLDDLASACDFERSSLTVVSSDGMLGVMQMV